MRKGLSTFTIVALVLGLVFLYLPIAVLIVYSFNASDLVVVWEGWSLQWYRRLMENRDLIEASVASFGIGVVAASAATALGTLAALVLTRMGRFPGRAVYSGLLYAPLIIPDIIMGLSLLLLFVAIDLDRGFWTIVAAHTTFSMSFVAVVVQARLVSFDASLEEAAMNLGCPPFRTFLTVTLPLIRPAVVAGWMLAFTLSLDDFIITNFVRSGNIVTLPVHIYGHVKRGLTPEINAISTLMIAVVALALVVASLMTKRAQLKHGALAAVR